MITLSGTDTLSGIAEIEYRINGGAAQHATNGQAVDVGLDGTITIAHRAIDVTGQASALKTDTLRVDTVLPVNTSAVPASTWQAAALSLPLSGTDVGGSGLATMQWRVDGGPIQDGSPAIVDTDGVHTLETRAVDTAGNETAWRPDTVRIDTTAPVNDTTAAPPAWITTPPYVVHVEGSDGAGSGVDRIERTIDNGAVSQDPDLTISTDGVYELRTRIVDEVGNASAWRLDTISIDATAPLNTTAVPDSTWQPIALELPLTGTDATSGVALMQWSVDGGTVNDGGPAVVDTDGVHTVETRAVDAADNQSLWRVDTVRVDTTAPVNDTPEPPAGWHSTPYTVHRRGLRRRRLRRRQDRAHDRRRRRFRGPRRDDLRRRRAHAAHPHRRPRRPCLRVARRHGPDRQRRPGRRPRVLARRYLEQPGRGVRGERGRRPVRHLLADRLAGRRRPAPRWRAADRSR